jgi:DNA-binding MarR family transcriptional regulator
MSTSRFPPVPDGLETGRISDIANRLNSSTIHFTRYLRAVRHSDGLTFDRRSLLSLLVFGGPQRMTEIARRELISVPAASRMVSALEDLELAERIPDPDDGRGVIVGATDRGRALMDTARAERVAALVESLAGLDNDDLDVLSRAAELMNQIATRAA